MTAFGDPLNTDSAGIPTSSKYGDRGDGTDEWIQSTTSADGADTALGATADAAETSPAATASLIALIKGLLTQLQSGTTTQLKLEDAAHASGDAGVMPLAVRRDTAAVSSGTDGDYEPLQTDADGRLRVLAQRDTDSGDVPSVDFSAAAEASAIVLAAAGVVHSIIVTTTVAQYIQLHDSTTVPADTAVPELSYYVPIGSTNIVLPGHSCGTGIVVCNSSTHATKTIGSADCTFTVYYD